MAGIPAARRLAAALGLVTVVPSGRKNHKPIEGASDAWAPLPLSLRDVRAANGSSRNATPGLCYQLSRRDVGQTWIGVATRRP